jgi:hypothetical protein
VCDAKTTREGRVIKQNEMKLRERKKERKKERKQKPISTPIQTQSKDKKHATYR